MKIDDLIESADVFDSMNLVLKGETRKVAAMEFPIAHFIEAGTHASFEPIPELELLLYTPAGWHWYANNEILQCKFAPASNEYEHIVSEVASAALASEDPPAAALSLAKSLAESTLPEFSYGFLLLTVADAWTFARTCKASIVNLHTDVG